MKIFKKMKKGFTLVELVVVIAVIAILAAVSVGAYFGVTESANNSRLEQESKQVYTAIQTVALAPNDHSSLSKDGLVITDDTKFELALEESLGKTVTLLENGNKVSNEPTIFFLTTAVSRLGGAEITYKTFEYHIPEISGKKAVADVVTGEVKVESSDVETGTDVPTTTVPDATTETPTIAPTVEPTQTPTTNPTVDPTQTSTVKPTVEEKTVDITAEEIVSLNKEKTGDDYRTMDLKIDDVITLSVTGTRLFKSTSNEITIRLYESQKATFRMSASNNKVIKSITLNYDVSNSGTLGNFANGVAVLFESTTTETISVSHSSGTKSGQIQISSIQVIYY